MVSCGRRLICVESISLCCFRNIRIREDGVLEFSTSRPHQFHRRKSRKMRGAGCLERVCQERERTIFVSRHIKSDEGLFNKSSCSFLVRI